MFRTIWHNRCALFACAVFISLPLSRSIADPTEDAAAKLCDNLAASIPDKTKPAGVPGVSAGAIDGPKAVEACEKAAAAFPNNLRIQFQYGRALVAAERSPDKVFALYTKAANGGHVVAMNNLGYVYEKGAGTPKDIQQAVKWYKKAADHGLAVAQRNIGLSFLNGTGLQKDGKAAVVWFTKAANQGDANSMNQLGILYDNGKDVPQDYVKAVKFYQAALAGGEVDAFSNVGWAYDRGIGGLPLDHVKANEIYLRGAAKGDGNSMNNYAESLITGEGIAKDITAGMEWMNKAFAAESSRAAYNLGWYYFEGKNVPRDIDKSVDYLIKALERNSDDVRVALIDKGGKDIPADVADLMQDKLLKRGGVFEKHDGTFGKGAVQYMEEILNGG